jgi:hypothetical protein
MYSRLNKVTNSAPFATVHITVTVIKIATGSASLTAKSTHRMGPSAAIAIVASPTVVSIWLPFDIAIGIVSNTLDIVDVR